tara:strand:+ start:729 stop:932 length:204 start_codon:yes stop_codon:yes gene_type:complete
MMITAIVASALVFGTVREVSDVYKKAQKIETLKKELKFREGQIDLLISQKNIAQQSKCPCKVIRTNK